MKKQSKKDRQAVGTGNDDNYEYCQNALKLKKNIEVEFLVLGEHLLSIRNKHLYQPHFSSWTEFLWEMKLSENVAKKLIQIYSVFIIQFGFKPEKIAEAGGWSVLQDILPMIKSKEDASKWLELAGAQTRSDLRKEIKESKTGIIMSSCKHKDTYVVEVCRDCGERHQLYGDFSDASRNP